MDQNLSNPPVGGQTPEPAAGPLIRTMSKDIEALEKKPQKEEVAFQPPGYEPPPEIPLGMAPPGGESMAGSPSTEIPVPPADLSGEALAKSEAMPSPVQQIPSKPAMGMPPPPPPPAPAPAASQRPTETVISEKALTEFAPPQPPKKDVKKLALIAGIVGLALIFGLAGWFLYPKIFPAATPIPTPPIIIPTPTPQPQTPTATPSPLPTPIVFFLKTPGKTVTLDIGDVRTKTELITAIKKETEQIETVGTLKIIDLREGGTAITFSQFANLMGLNFPAELAGLILPEFKLFVNSHAQEGNRLGFILSISDPAMAKIALGTWETTIDTDLVDLFLGADTGEKTEFKTASYREITKRYLSFSKPPFSIDYGIYQNFLIISTSRFSFANAIDHILGEEE